MTVSIARAYNPVEVDLWGTKFETIDVPRSGAKKAQALEDEIDTIERGEEMFDELVEKIAELMDIKLVPVEGSKKPSTIVKKKWKSDDLSIGQLMSFFREVQQLEGEGNRPT